MMGCLLFCGFESKLIFLFEKGIFYGIKNFRFAIGAKSSIVHAEKNATKLENTVSWITYKLFYIYKIRIYDKPIEISTHTHMCTPHTTYSLSALVFVTHTHTHILNRTHKHKCGSKRIHFKNKIDYITSVIGVTRKRIYISMEHIME